MSDLMLKNCIVCRVYNLEDYIYITTNSGEYINVNNKEFILNFTEFSTTEGYITGNVM